MKILFLRRRFFLVRKVILKRKRHVVLENEPPNWKKAGESFQRLIRKNRDEIIRLCDARTYRDLYIEDGIEPPC
ncbi:MAG: hypothetical protein AAB394_01700 [Patescibacteria group bacterium]